MGLFFYTQKGSIISMVDLPTTEIIEPNLFVCEDLRNPIRVDKYQRTVNTAVFFNTLKIAINPKRDIFFN